MGAYGGAEGTLRAFEVNPHLGNAMAGQAVELVDGTLRCDIEGSWARGDGQIDLTADKPLPALIRSLIMQVEHEP